jgi:hypothetical protein
MSMWASEQRRAQRDRLFAYQAERVRESPDAYTNVRVKRVAAGLTQVELSRAVGCSLGVIRRADVGQRVNKSSQRRIEDALHAY